MSVLQHLRLTSRLGKFLFIFILISFSSPSHQPCCGRVCVCVWTICTDVKLLSGTSVHFYFVLCSRFSAFIFMQGAPGAWIGQVPTKTPIQCLWYHGWSPWCTCQFFQKWGRGSTQEPPCRPFELFIVLHCCRNLELLLVNYDWFSGIRTFLRART